MSKSFKRFIDFIGIPFSLISSIWNVIITRSNERTMPISYAIFRKFGVLPVRDHYYQPLINPKKHLKQPLDADRPLPGINMNIKGQLELLDRFNYREELLSFPIQKNGSLEYYYDNNRYESGDSEYLYNIIRYFKPKKIIEIGSGMSTLMAINAIEKNKAEDKHYDCKHICVEPYEMRWLENTEVELIRAKVEDIAIDTFTNLQENDLLFIDSSHMIRPQGDVLIEILQVLPFLKKGVIVHIHDIFTPKDYPAEWIYVEHRLWNEQYLLEAYLSNNNKYEIIGALNFLKNNYPDQLSHACPVIGGQPLRQPGGFWIRSVHS